MILKKIGFVELMSMVLLNIDMLFYFFRFCWSFFCKEGVDVCVGFIKVGRGFLFGGRRIFYI